MKVPLTIFQRVLDVGYEMAGKLQDLELTDHEYAMVMAVCVMQPGMNSYFKCINLKNIR